MAVSLHSGAGSRSQHSLLAAPKAQATVLSPGNFEVDKLLPMLLKVPGNFGRLLIQRQAAVFTRTSHTTNLIFWVEVQYLLGTEEITLSKLALFPTCVLFCLNLLTPRNEGGGKRAACNWYIDDYLSGWSSEDTGGGVSMCVPPSLSKPYFMSASCPMSNRQIFLEKPE